MSRIDIHTGDAWDLSNIPDHSVDLVYVGLNLHHATPEELLHTLREIRRVLKPDGLFFNHDSYRPEGTPRLLRPSNNPRNHEESFILVPQHKLENIALPPEIGAGVEAADAGTLDWRRLFVPRFAHVLMQRGGDVRGIEATSQHIFDRDFSLTISEMKALVTAAGFSKVEGSYFSDTNEPLGAYYGTLRAYP